MYFCCRQLLIGTSSFLLVWLLGNLARATYVGSSDYVWPWSYNECNSRERESQEINACAKVAHYGLEPGRGRGAPEIDLIEAMQGDMTEKLPSTNISRPYQSLSLQIAPGIENDRPSLGLRPRKVCFVYIIICTIPKYATREWRSLSFMSDTSSALSGPLVQRNGVCKWKSD